MQANTVPVPLEKMIFRNSVYGWIVREGKLLGELVAEALAREIREETGITVKMGKLARVEEDFFYYNPGDEAVPGLSVLLWVRSALHLAGERY